MVQDRITDGFFNGIDPKRTTSLALCLNREARRHSVPQFRPHSRVLLDKFDNIRCVEHKKFTKTAGNHCRCALYAAEHSNFAEELTFPKFDRTLRQYDLYFA